MQLWNNNEFINQTYLIEIRKQILIIKSMEWNVFLGISFREPVKSFLISLKAFRAGRKESSVFACAFRIRYRLIFLFFILGKYVIQFCVWIFMLLYLVLLSHEYSDVLVTGWFIDTGAVVSLDFFFRDNEPDDRLIHQLFILRLNFKRSVLL